MGRDGWLGIGWPKEYGGQGRTAARAVHLLRRGEPRRRPDAARHAQHGRADAHAHFGSDEQKDEFLPKILAGELHFAIGYTEPGAGTDLASLRTRAVRDGDEYVINGQKVFTTGGHDADCGLARVPDRSRRAEAQGHLDHPRADRRRPGSSTRRSGRSAAVTRTPRTTRTCACRSANRRRRARTWAGSSSPASSTTSASRSGRPVASNGRCRGAPLGAGDDASPTAARHRRRVGADLAGAGHAVVEALKLANWRVAAALDEGNLNPANASAMKVLGTEQQWRCLDLLLEIVGSAGYLVGGSPGCGAPRPARAGVPRTRRSARSAAA